MKLFFSVSVRRKKMKKVEQFETGKTLELRVKLINSAVPRILEWVLTPRTSPYNFSSKLVDLPGRFAVFV